MLCLAPLLLSTAALIDPMPWVYERGLASTAWVRAEGEAAGTGIVVDVAKKWLVTCRHVVADRKTVEVFFPWRRDGVLVVDRQAYLSNRDTLRTLGLLVTGTVLRTSDAADLALVELPGVPHGAKAVKFPVEGSGYPLEPSDRLLAIGHRQDLDSLWNATRGYVRQRNRLTEGYAWRSNKLAVNAFAILAQLPIEEGDSGGPVFDDAGRLAGMTVALRRACPDAAIVIDASEIKSFLRGNAQAADETTTARHPQSSDRATPFALLQSVTLWVRPTATDYHTAAVLVDARKRLYLTSARGLGPGDRCPVAFAPEENARFDRKSFLDPVSGAWRAARVLAKDRRRDLALLQLERTDPGDPPEGLSLATDSPGPGRGVHAMSHPAGLEFAWVYAAGSVRQRGRVSLGPRDDPEDRVDALILQLPTQGRSPGGPVINEKGDLVGVMAAREGALGQVGYAVSSREIATFLDSAWPFGTPRTWDGVLARALHAVQEWRSEQVALHVRDACGFVKAGQHDKAQAALDRALKLDPDSPSAVFARATRLTDVENRPDDAAAMLDRLISQGCRDDHVLQLRVQLARDRKNLRLARGLAAMRAELSDDPGPYRILAALEFELGDEEKAAIVYSQFLRRGGSLADLCTDLKSQVDESLKRNPDSHGRAAEWVRKVFAEASKYSPGQLILDLKPLLNQAKAAASDQDRLRVFRIYLEEHSK